jgi:DNA-binding phage protein
MSKAMIKKTPRSRKNEDAMAEVFQKDPAYAVALINDILQDGAQDEFLIVLRQLTKAFGGVSAVAEEAALNPTQLYRTLSAQGNPSLTSLAAILKPMGFRLAIEQIESLNQCESSVAA